MPAMPPSDPASPVFWQETAVDKTQRSLRLGQKPIVLWLTGLSGAGKTSIANAVEAQLHSLGHATYLLDGDNIRHGLCSDLGFSPDDRVENIRRIGEVARILVDAGLIVLASFISPSDAQRQTVRRRFGTGEFHEVYVSTPLDVCEQRDPKGLYKLARAGKLAQFTGISGDYEPPSAPELTMDTSARPLADCARELVEYVMACQRQHQNL